MENLFTVRLSVNHHHVPYHVFFDQEQYTFRAEGEGAEPAEFSLRRAHDEWHGQEELPAGLGAQAIQALEHYLLRQH